MLIYTLKNLISTLIENGTPYTYYTEEGIHFIQILK